MSSQINTAVGFSSLDHFWRGSQQAHDLKMQVSPISFKVRSSGVIKPISNDSAFEHVFLPIISRQKPTALFVKTGSLESFLKCIESGYNTHHIRLDDCLRRQVLPSSISPWLMCLKNPTSMSCQKLMFSKLWFIYGLLTREILVCNPYVNNNSQILMSCRAFVNRDWNITALHGI